MAKKLRMVLLLAMASIICGCSAGHTIGGGGGGGGLGQLYVTTPTSILRFASALSANGNVAPTATITGGATTLSAPQRMVLDVTANRLFVANQGTNAILIFENASTLNGNVAPTRTIAGAATGISGPFDLALDPANNLLYVTSGSNILVFAGASTINGNSPPVRTINMAVTINGIFLDATNNILYVADSLNNTVDRLDGASTQSGTAVVTGSIVGVDTGLAHPTGMVLDGTGRLFVSNTSTPSLTVYANPNTSTGDVIPAETISGTLTKLGTPGQLAFNKTASTGEVYVADSLTGSLLVYSGVNSTGGNIAPARTISGNLTGLNPNAVGGVVLDTTR